MSGTVKLAEAVCRNLKLFSEIKGSNVLVLILFFSEQSLGKVCCSGGGLVGQSVGHRLQRPSWRCFIHKAPGAPQARKAFH